MNFRMALRKGVLLLALGLGDAALASPPDLSGHWVSTAPEHSGQVYARRDFQIDPVRWQVLYRAYADVEARIPLFTLEVGGVYVLGGPSGKVPGAYEGIFPATHRRLSADSEAGVALFSNMGCTLQLRVATSLLTSGCGFVPGLMQAMGEYDLVAIRDGRLFFGDRSGDLTRQRPEALTPFPLMRKAPGE